MGSWISEKFDETAAIQDAKKLWENEDSAWVLGMNYRYIKNRGLDRIQSKRGDSACWKS